MSKTAQACKEWMAEMIGRRVRSVDLMTPEDVYRPNEVQQKRGTPGVRGATRKGSRRSSEYSRRTRHPLVHDGLRKEEALQSDTQGEPRP